MLWDPQTVKSGFPEHYRSTTMATLRAKWTPWLLVGGRGSSYNVDMSEKGRLHLLGGTQQVRIRCHDAAEKSMQFKIGKSFISEILHLIIMGQSWPQVTQTRDSCQLESGVGWGETNDFLKNKNQKCLLVKLLKTFRLTSSFLILSVKISIIIKPFFQGFCIIYSLKVFLHLTPDSAFRTVLCSSMEQIFPHLTTEGPKYGA